MHVVLIVLEIGLVGLLGTYAIVTLGDDKDTAQAPACAVMASGRETIAHTHRNKFSFIVQPLYTTMAQAAVFRPVFRAVDLPQIYIAVLSS